MLLLKAVEYIEGFNRLKRAVKDNEYKYCLQLDVYHCYEHLDHDILKSKLSRKFKDKRLLNLLFIIIDSCPDGVPIGNYTSQYFNNFYFTKFDHWIKENKMVKYYFRYCDDIVILGKSKEYLRDLFRQIKMYFDLLKVEIKGNYKIFPKTIGINFLGFITYIDHRAIRKRTKLNFIRKAKLIFSDNLPSNILNVLGSYWGILKTGDCRHLWLTYTKQKDFKSFKYWLEQNNGAL